MYMVFCSVFIAKQFTSLPGGLEIFSVKIGIANAAFLYLQETISFLPCLHLDIIASCSGRVERPSSPMWRCIYDNRNSKSFTSFVSLFFYARGSFFGGGGNGGDTIYLYEYCMYTSVLAPSAF